MTNQDVSKQLNYSSVFDLLTDLLVSTLDAYTYGDSGIQNYGVPATTIELDLRTALVDKSITFNNKIVNVQTGKLDLLKDSNTTIIFAAPGTAHNINIVSYYNSYPISPNRAISHSFMPHVRGLGANPNPTNGPGTPAENGVTVVYHTDNYVPGSAPSID
jgi:hypothetical protein